jgi:hypothetical protein
MKENDHKLSLLRSRSKVTKHKLKLLAIKCKCVVNLKSLFVPIFKIALGEIILNFVRCFECFVVLLEFNPVVFLLNLFLH